MAWQQKRGGDPGRSRSAERTTQSSGVVTGQVQKDESTCPRHGRVRGENTMNWVATNRDIGTAGATSNAWRSARQRIQSATVSGQEYRRVLKHCTHTRQVGQIRVVLANRTRHPLPRESRRRRQVPYPERSPKQRRHLRGPKSVVCQAAPCGITPRFYFLSFLTKPSRFRSFHWRLRGPRYDGGHVGAGGGAAEPRDGGDNRQRQGHCAAASARTDGGEAARAPRQFLRCQSRALCLPPLSVPCRLRAVCLPRASPGCDGSRVCVL